MLFAVYEGICCCHFIFKKKGVYIEALKQLEGISQGKMERMDWMSERRDEELLSQHTGHW